MSLHHKTQYALELLEEQLTQQRNIAIASSFGKDSMVVLDLCKKINPEVPVFGLISDTEFPETLNFIDEIVDRWGLKYTEYRYEQRQQVLDGKVLCCNQQKVYAFEKAIEGLDAWVSGVRATETPERKGFKHVEQSNNLIKVNPILDFSELDIWRYLAANEVPLHPLYKKGYRSLGCMYCSSTEQSEYEGERDGRWRNSDHQGGECGIHLTGSQIDKKE